MATFTASAAQSTAAPKYIERGMIARSCIWTFSAAAASAGDVVQMIRVPAGAHIHDVSVVNDFNAASATFAVNVGDGNSATRYIGSATEDTIVVRAETGVGYSYSVEDTIDIVVATAASASVGATVRVTVFYSMDQTTDGTGS